MESRRTNNKWFYLGITLWFLARVPAALSQQTSSCTVPALDRKQVCAVENVIQAQEGTACEIDGKTYWVCCPRCAEAIKKDPDAYRLARDPVSGAVVDKAVALIHAHAGRVFFFDSEATRAAFVREPEHYTAMASPR